MDDFPNLEQRLRWYVASDWRRSAGPTSTPLSHAPTTQEDQHADPDSADVVASKSSSSFGKLAVLEADQTLALLSRLYSIQHLVASPPRSTAAPLDADGTGATASPRTPPSSSDVVAAGKDFPHHVRYLASGSRTSHAKCLFYLNEANDSGSRLAFVELGLHLLYGWGCARDVPKALALLDRGIERQHPAAMLAVSECLRRGDGVPIDLRAAYAWRLRAAEMSFAPAQHAVAEWLEEGIEQTVRRGQGGGVVFAVERDLIGAMRWYKAAAAVGFAPSQLNLAKLFLCATRMDVGTAAARSDADAKASYWLQQAALNGSVEARTLLQHQSSDSASSGSSSRASQRSHGQNSM